MIIQRNIKNIYVTRHVILRPEYPGAVTPANHSAASGQCQRPRRSLLSDMISGRHASYIQNKATDPISRNRSCVKVFACLGGRKKKSLSLFFFFWLRISKDSSPLKMSLWRELDGAAKSLGLLDSVGTKNGELEGKRE